LKGFGLVLWVVNEIAEKDADVISTV
jgi:hypothetical protein